MLSGSFPATRFCVDMVASLVVTGISPRTPSSVAVRVIRPTAAIFGTTLAAVIGCFPISVARASVSRS